MPLLAVGVVILGMVVLLSGDVSPVGDAVLSEDGGDASSDAGDASDDAGCASGVDAGGVDAAVGAGGSAPVVTPVAKRRGRPPKSVSDPAPAAVPVVEVKKKRTFSAASKAKMAAAQKARWAKKNGTAPAAVEAPVVKTRKKRTMSPEARARIAAAQKARWAKVKKA